ncbi:hypothetical protein ACU5AY_05825 [Rhizobium sp. PAMB 3174]
MLDEFLSSESGTIRQRRVIKWPTVARARLPAMQEGLDEWWFDGA